MGTIIFISTSSSPRQASSCVEVSMDFQKLSFSCDHDIAHLFFHQFPLLERRTYWLLAYICLFCHCIDKTWWGRSFKQISNRSTDEGNSRSTSQRLVLHYALPIIDCHQSTVHYAILKWSRRTPPPLNNLVWRTEFMTDLNHSEKNHLNNLYRVSNIVDESA